MKIRKTLGNILKTYYDYDVFGIHWKNKGTVEVCYYGLSGGDFGLSFFDVDEKIEVIDPNLNFKTVFIQDGDTSAIMHWALIEENLLYDLVDKPNYEAYNRFLEIIKSEGLVDEDFY